MNIQSLRAEGRRHIAALDCDLLLMHALNISRNDVLAYPNRPISPHEADFFNALVKRRAAHEPMAYILDSKEFMSLEFSVCGCLIPRGDTEVLVSHILEQEGAAYGLEIGAGSGCIAISLAYYGGMNMDCVDISPQALETTARNAKKHNVQDKIELFLSDLFPDTQKQYDFIVSNPPYIPQGELSTLQNDIKLYEPIAALDGGQSGLEFYQKISSRAKDFLAPSGRIYYEIGYNQAKAVQNILIGCGFTSITTLKDLSGHDRVLSARRAYV